MLHGIGKFLVEIICCRFRLGSYRPVHSVSDTGGVVGSKQKGPPPQSLVVWDVLESGTNSLLFCFPLRSPLKMATQTTTYLF